MSIGNGETGKRTYYNSWITDKPTGAGNEERPVGCGRARWKTGNGHNNVLKNRGYNLEHNFGHGENPADESFCLLNLTAVFSMKTGLLLFFSSGEMSQTSDTLNCCRRETPLDFYLFYVLYCFNVIIQPPAGDSENRRNEGTLVRGL
jgi:amino acid permease